MMMTIMTMIRLMTMRMSKMFKIAPETTLFLLLCIFENWIQMLVMEVKIKMLNIFLPINPKVLDDKYSFRGWS